MSASTGHYVAYAQHQASSCRTAGSATDWLLLDDGLVSRAPDGTMGTVLTPIAPSPATPYLLFYEMQVDEPDMAPESE